MLYLIIPPIIVVVSLALLVYFFSRKFPQIEEMSKMRGESLGRTIAIAEDRSNKVKHFFLHVLEKIVQWFKVSLLKTHNASHRLVQYLRAKKNDVSASRKPHFSREIPENRQEDIAMFQRQEQKPTIDRREEISRSILSKDDAAFDSEPTFSEEKIVVPDGFIRKRKPRPMVSMQAALPKKEEKKEKKVMAVVKEEQSIPAKNQLEDILIERIAVNPRDLEAYERLGEYYMEQGNLQDAKECYRQVLRLSPVHRLAKIKIRRLERKLEQK